MSLPQANPKQITVDIRCSHCAAQGELVWDMDGGQPSFISVSSGFYERLSRKPPYPIELVCRGCGTAQKETV